MYFELKYADMRTLLILIFILGSVSGLAQDTINSVTTSFSDEHLTSGQPEVYVYNNTAYTFTPTGMGYTITLIENGQQVEFGQLRQTTDDGYFMLTTDEDQEASFGRFDGDGNFRALRLDKETDDIIEENFLIQNPVERRNQQRISRDTMY